MKFKKGNIWFGWFCRISSGFFFKGQTENVQKEKNRFMYFDMKTDNMSKK